MPGLIVFAIMYSVDRAVDSSERLDRAWLRCNAVLPQTKNGTVNSTVIIIIAKTVRLLTYTHVCTMETVWGHFY